MAYKIHERDLRGKTDLGWLDSKHTFSFSGFQDPQRMGFRKLRVINEDIVAPGGGFKTHPHENMEIISYVMRGALEHKDSMGNGSIIRPGEVQKMSAGTGVTHSEFNHSQEEQAHFLQIWVEPSEQDLEPSYEQKAVDFEKAKQGFVVVGSREGGDGAVIIHQDIKMLLAAPAAEQDISYNFAPGRHGFLQVVKGQIEVEGETLKEGDGLEISDIEVLKLTAKTESELMLFDLK